MRRSSRNRQGWIPCGVVQAQGPEALHALGLHRAGAALADVVAPEFALDHVDLDAVDAEDPPPLAGAGDFCLLLAGQGAQVVDDAPGPDGRGLPVGVEVGVHQLDELHRQPVLQREGEDVVQLVLVLALDERVQLHPLEHLAGGLDAVQNGRDAGAGLGNGPEGLVGEVVQGDLHLVQAGRGEPVLMAAHQQAVRDQCVGHVRAVDGKLSENRPRQLRRQRLAAGEVDPLQASADQLAQDVHVVVGGQFASTGLDLPVQVSERRRHVAFVVAEPALQIADGVSETLSCPLSAAKFRSAVQSTSVFGSGTVKTCSFRLVSSSHERDGREQVL